MRTSGSGLAMACGAAALMTVFGSSAGAQVSSRPDPSDPKAEAPAVRYESAFKGYRRFEDEAVTSWRDANDLVYQLGGWKAFANDQVPDIPASASGAPQGAKPAQQQDPAGSGGHAGHKTR